MAGSRNIGWKKLKCFVCKSTLCFYIPKGKYAFCIKCPHRIKSSHKKCSNTEHHGNIITYNMEQFRCQCKDKKRSERNGTDIKCNKLLGEVFPGSKVSIRCPRCKSTSEFDK